MTVRIIKTLICSLILIQLNACAVGPDYVRPQTTTPVNFKELKGWKQAQPRDNLLKGKWWEIFNDTQLNKLEEQVVIGNQSIAQAEAQYRQAQDLVRSAQSAFFPTATVSATTNRFRAASGQSVAVRGVRDLFGTAIALAWEPDIWGSIRRQIEANENTAQASAATLQALQLSTQANLAMFYFQMRALDAQKGLFDETVAAYSKTLEITKNRYAAGVVAKTDVVQAEAQLESVRAQGINLGVQRANLEHAIAVLTGKPPAELSLSAKPLDLIPPPIPVSLPSELLERRPDIASAER